MHALLLQGSSVQPVRLAEWGLGPQAKASLFCKMQFWLKFLPRWLLDWCNSARQQDVAVRHGQRGSETLLTRSELEYWCGHVATKLCHFKEGQASAMLAILRMPRAPELVVAIFSCLLAGRCCVHLFVFPFSYAFSILPSWQLSSILS
jgi:hypothetical protein